MGGGWIRCGLNERKLDELCRLTLEMESGIPQGPKTYAFKGFDFSPGLCSQG